MPFLNRSLALPTLLSALLSLSGCLYDSAPSGPMQNIDTWVLGQWSTQDKAGHQFSAIITPQPPDHYKVEFQKPGGGYLEFDGWISRVDDFSILVLKSLNQDGSFGKCALYHYELLTQGLPPVGGVGANRIRLSELQLDASTRSLDPIKLRAAIRSALKDGTLLAPYDVVASRKGEFIEQKIFDLEVSTASKASTNASKVSDSALDQLNKLKELKASIKDVPGSVIWSKTGGVTINGETF